MILSTENSEINSSMYGINYFGLDLTKLIYFNISSANISYSKSVVFPWSVTDTYCWNLSRMDLK